MNLLLAGGILAGLPIVAQGAWWTVLGLRALPRHRDASDSTADIDGELAILVPAHNEEQLLGMCLRSLADAAAGRRAEVVVIADNCSDRTAEIAREAGVTVLERQSETERGKNFALDFAVKLLAMRDVPPAGVAVVDADTLVSTNFVQEIRAALAKGAEAVQVHYRAPFSEMPIGRLRRLALGLVHWSRPLGAGRMGIGTTLKGNGMGFTWAAAKDGIGGHGITEDAAFTLSLARRGITVRFVPGAWVEGFMATDYDAARTQDDRWERGRLGLMREAWSTAVSRFAAGDVSTAMAAVEAGSLPLTLALAAGTVAGVVILVGGGSVVVAALPVGAIVAGASVGLVASRPSREDVSALVHAPRFVAYKLGVLAGIAMSRGKSPAWVRTARE